MFAYTHTHMESSCHRHFFSLMSLITESVVHAWKQEQGERQGNGTSVEFSNDMSG